MFPLLGLKDTGSPGTPFIPFTRVRLLVLRPTPITYAPLLFCWVRMVFPFLSPSDKSLTGIPSPDHKSYR